MVYAKLGNDALKCGLHGYVSLDISSGGHAALFMDINQSKFYISLRRKVEHLARLISTPQLAGGLYDEYTSAESLDQLLVQSIDEALTDLLGKRTRDAVYDHLERNYALGRTDIPDHMNKFFELMEETFGKGSKTIGKAIIKKMFGKLEWNFVEIPGYEFMDYLEAIRKRITRTLIEQVNSSSKIQ